MQIAAATRLLSMVFSVNMAALIAGMTVWFIDACRLLGASRCGRTCQACPSANWASTTRWATSNCCHPQVYSYSQICNTALYMPSSHCALCLNKHVGLLHEGAIYRICRSPVR